MSDIKAVTGSRMSKVASDRIQQRKVIFDCLASATAALLSALLLGSCFRQTGVETIAWFALVPFLLTVRLSGRSWSAMSAGIVGGLFFHLYATDFIRLGDTEHGGSGPYVLYWFALGSVGALVWTIAATLIRCIARSTSVPMSVIVPCIWTLCDYGRLNIFVLLDQTGFPFLQLGLTQVDNALVAQVAAIGGVYAITWLVAMGNGFLLDIFIWRAPYRKTLLLSGTITAFIAAAVFIYGDSQLDSTHSTSSEDGPLVVVGTGRFVPHSSLSCFLQDRDAGTVNASNKPDLIVYPELTLGGSIVEWQSKSRADESQWNELHQLLPFKTTDKNSDDRELLLKQMRTLDTALLVGCYHAVVEQGWTHVYNSSVFVKPNARLQPEVVGYYDKYFLAPGGDFVPYLLSCLHIPTNQLPFKAVPRLNDPSWEHPIGFDRGKRAQSFFIQDKATNKEFEFSTLICYDMCFSESVRRARVASPTTSGPDFFVQCSNESLDQSRLSQLGLLQMARLRAIESRRAIARSVIDGYSAIIDGSGRIIDSAFTSNGQSRLIARRIPIDRRHSLYAVVGDWIPLGAGAMLGLIYFARRTTGTPT